MHVNVIVAIKTVFKTVNGFLIGERVVIVKGYFEYESFHCGVNRLGGNAWVMSCIVGCVEKSVCCCQGTTLSTGRPAFIRSSWTSWAASVGSIESSSRWTRRVIVVEKLRVVHRPRAEGEGL